jgi:DNA ligase-1
MYLKPMLAGKATDNQIEKLFAKGPLEASFKLDGIRCMIQDGVALSRSLKPIRNKHVQSVIGRKEFNGFDGELIVGEPTASDVYRNTTSHVMSENKEFKFSFWIFDFLNNDIYKNRKKEISFLKQVILQKIIPEHDHTLKMLGTKTINTMEELEKYEVDCLEIGYEGVILRDPNTKYKHGRSTVKEGGLIKVKRFNDSEARILGVEEQMKNNNEKKVNELGRGQRSSHKENKTPKGTLGALVVKDIYSGVQFNIGTGFTNTIRDQLWKYKDGLVGQAIKYKYFSIGVKDAPRHPVYLGMRDDSDIS